MASEFLQRTVLSMKPRRTFCLIMFIKWFVVIVGFLHKAYSVRAL